MHILLHWNCIALEKFQWIVFVKLLFPTILFVNLLYQVHYPVCEAILIVKPQDYLDCCSVNLKYDI